MQHSVQGQGSSKTRQNRGQWLCKAGLWFLAHSLRTFAHVVATARCTQAPVSAMMSSPRATRQGLGTA